MGPRAGLDLYENILASTPATTDQDHLSVVLMSFSRDIGDRTLFLEGKAAANPAYEIIKVIERLVASGAGVIGIACNTSHSPAIFDVIRTRVNKLENKPVLLHMPWEVCNHISRELPGISKIGLMTTNGMYRSGLYKSLLEDRGYEVIVPDVHFQDTVIHRMVYDPTFGIKASSTGIAAEVRELCDMALSFFKKSRAEAVILGCTEFSLALRAEEVDGIAIVDSTKCLAKALVREAMAELSIPCQL
jgi:aspartate racemase